MNDTKLPTVEVRSLLDFLIRLGQAYLASGEQTAEVEQILRQAMSAYGFQRGRAVAFPTAIFLSLHHDDQEHVTLAEGPLHGLRLDQIADVYQLGEQAERGEIAPDVGIRTLIEISKRPAHFGPLGAIGGHMILSVGLAMVLGPTLPNLTAAAELGALVGGIKKFNLDRPVLSIPMSVVAATMVSSLTFLAVKLGFPIDPQYALIPPLVTFLPGARLTLGMVEMAFGDIVSGTSRLIDGFVQLLLLAFGLAAGAAITGYSPENLVDTTTVLISNPATLAAAWIGVVFFGVGVYFHFSAPRGSLSWILFVVLAAFAVQKVASDFLGQIAGGFFGMIAVTLLSYLIQTQWKGPPAMVTFLPGFWILVPGALGLLSVKHMLSDREAGLDGLMSALLAITSIALGTLIGASIYRWMIESYRWWRIYGEHATRYIRRNRSR